jgi:hypothetical protein
MIMIMTISISTPLLRTMPQPKLFTSIHTSYRHKYACGLYSCHNRIRLPSNLILSILSWSSTPHNVYLGVAFYDRAGWGVDMMKWYDEWHADLDALKDEKLYPPDAFLDWDDYGLEVIVKIGKRSQGCAEVDVTWDPNPTEGCQDGCREYQLVQEYGTGRMVLGVAPVPSKWVQGS